MLARSIPRIQLFTCISWTFDHFHYCYQIPRLSWVDTSWFQSIVEYVHGARNIASKKHKCWSAEFTFYDKKVVNFQPAVKFVINKSKRKSFGMSSPVKVFEGNACSKDLHRNYLESVNKCSWRAIWGKVSVSQQVNSKQTIKQEHRFFKMLKLLSTIKP